MKSNNINYFIINETFNKSKNVIIEIIINDSNFAIIEKTFNIINFFIIIKSFNISIFTFKKISNLNNKKENLKNVIIIIFELKNKNIMLRNYLI